MPAEPSWKARNIAFRGNQIWGKKENSLPRHKKKNKGKTISICKSCTSKQNWISANEIEEGENVTCAFNQLPYKVIYAPCLRIQSGYNIFMWFEWRYELKWSEVLRRNIEDCFSWTPFVEENWNESRSFFSYFLHIGQSGEICLRHEYRIMVATIESQSCGMTMRVCFNWFHLRKFLGWLVEVDVSQTCAGPGLTWLSFA